MQITVFYVGSSLLAPLKNAERELNREFHLQLQISVHNFGLPLADDDWRAINQELSQTDIVFVIHVMDGENASRLIAALEESQSRHRAVIVINCMPELMRRTRMGGLDASSLMRSGKKVKGERETGSTRKGVALLSGVGSWVGKQTRKAKAPGKGNSGNGHNGHGQYLKFINRLPGLLRFVPNAGKLRDVKNYLNIFCYFLQPTPANIRSMVLCALKEYVPDERLRNAKIELLAPESTPAVAIYHPDAPQLFETFDEYRSWYEISPGSKVQGPKSNFRTLKPDSTVGLLLMRPQVISRTTKHYDALIRAIEAQGLGVIPALSTLMDNREAVSRFFTRDGSKSNPIRSPRSKVQGLRSKAKAAYLRPQTHQLTTDN